MPMAEGQSSSEMLRGVKVTLVPATVAVKPLREHSKAGSERQEEGSTLTSSRVPDDALLVTFGGQLRSSVSIQST